MVRLRILLTPSNIVLNVPVLSDPGRTPKEKFKLPVMRRAFAIGETTKHGGH
jgi:hypothetical protein